MTETEFEFDLVFALPEGSADEDEIIDALFESGCGDAAVGFGTPDLVGLGFTRAGRDPESVILAAVERAMAGLPDGTRLREARPDLVSMADVASRLNVTRQALQKRPMPPPSLGGLYRVSEMTPYLDAVPGKLRDGFHDARAWFAAAPGAQRVNAGISLAGSEREKKSA